MNTGTPERVNVPVESKLGCNATPGRRHVANRARLMRADAALKTGQAQHAADLAGGILEEDSKHLGALETFAKSLWRASRFEQVVAATDRLLALNPYEPGYHALRGAALQALGRYAEAIECFDRSRDLPGSVDALRELQIWQAGLLSELLSADPVFKASYAQNPQKACEAKGFKFLEEKAQDQWHTPEFDRTWSYSRPS
jgi:tetratricopeptide (TPR) repeat protein